VSLFPFPFPFYINVFNRLSPVKQIIKDLQRFGAQLEGGIRITIVDNASTYPPLLAWYDTKPEGVRIIRRATNGGPRGWWDVMDHFTPFYGVCDPDIDLSGIPSDFLERLVAGLIQFPDIEKVGPSIRIDDVPEAFPFHSNLMQDEAQYRKYRRGWWWVGDLDTMFIVCRTGRPFAYGPALRSPPPYSVRHLTNYMIPGHLSDEDQYYIQNLPQTHKPGLFWSTMMQDSGFYDRPA